MQAIRADTLSHFPPDRFSISVHCECGHSGDLDTSALSPDLSLDELQRRLRCRECGSRDIQMRISWSAADLNGWAPRLD